MAGLLHGEDSGQLFPANMHVERIGLNVEECPGRAEAAELPINFNRRCSIRYEHADRTECLEASNQFLPAADIQIYDAIGGKGSDDLDLRHAQIECKLQRHFPGFSATAARMRSLVCMTVSNIPALPNLRLDARRTQRSLKRATLGGRLSSAIAVQQLSRSLCKHPAHLAAFPFDSRNCEAVVAGRLVTHPGYYGSLGPLFDRNAFRSGNSSTTHRRRMLGDGSRQAFGQVRIAEMEVEESHHRSAEIFNVFGLCLLASTAIRGLAFGVGLGGPLCIELGTNSFDGCRGGPNAAREYLAASFFSDDPMISGDFTRRVKAASPGGSRIQPAGAARTWPLGDRTVFGVGPGVNIGATIFNPFPNAKKNAHPAAHIVLKNLEPTRIHGSSP